MSANNDFDDCEICKAMRRAESRGKDLSREELNEAFRKQKLQGKGVVGFGLKNN